LKEIVNDNLILVGTAHILKESVLEVEEAIKEHQPRIVAVELDQKRFEALTKKQQWEEASIFKIIKEGKAYLLMAQIFLASIQRRLGKEYGVEPGSEMLAAINAAEEGDLEVALVDRDITITMKKAWVGMGLREKLRLFWEFNKALIGFYDEEEVDIEELMKEDIITTMVEELKEIAPSVTEVLIFERDAYIAKKLHELSREGKVVGVVGAGHLNGIKENLKNIDKTPSFEELEEIPSPKFRIGSAIVASIVFLLFGGWILNLFYPDYSRILDLYFLNLTFPILVGAVIGAASGFILGGKVGPKSLGLFIPIFLAILVGYLLCIGDWERLQTMFLYWFLINGLLSAIGAALAGGHPITVFTAFVAAPFTSLNPSVAAGWFAGLVEAKLRTPTVKDFQEMSTYETMRQYFRNRVFRILMVMALANLGSTIGTWVAVWYILPLFS
jgi:pheromone shutdown-related protein TraB